MARVSHGVVMLIKLKTRSAVLLLIDSLSVTTPNQNPTPPGPIVLSTSKRVQKPRVI